MIFLGCYPFLKCFVMSDYVFVFLFSAFLGPKLNIVFFILLQQQRYYYEEKREHYYSTTNINVYK